MRRMTKRAMPLRMESPAPSAKWPLTNRFFMNGTLMREKPFSVLCLRRSAICRPLAVLLAILLMPTFSWFESAHTGVRAFQASAQIVANCFPNPSNAIIQTYCPAGEIEDPIADDLRQLERDAGNAYLGLHELPAADASVISTYGRQDLRDAIRASMITQMLAIVKKPASQRTQHEQALYNWLQKLVQQNEVALYTKAVQNAQLFSSDPCTFTLDADIASTYSLHYDGHPFCGGQQSAIFGAPVPAASYFTAYGFKYSYAAAAQTVPYFGSMMADTSISYGEQAAIALSAGSVVAAVVGAAIFANLSAALVAFSTAAALSGPGSIAAAAGSTFLVSGAAVGSIGLGALVAAPVAIILITISVGVMAALQLSTNAQNQNDIAILSNLLNQARDNPPDLAAMAADTSGLGLYKIQVTMNSQTVPEVASGAVLPSHRPGTDLDFAIAGAGGAPSISSSLAYRDWDGNNWSAETWGGWFVETCTTVNQDVKCLVPDSINANIRYVDGDGVKWTASRIGNNFVNTKASPSATDVMCPADTVSGLTPVTTDLRACASYVSDHITLKDADGNLATVKLSVLTPPVVSGSATLAFGPGVPSTQAITLLGNPTPAVCVSNGSLTADFTLNVPNCETGTAPTTGKFQIQFNGNASAATATYALTLSATNSAGATSIPVAINVSPQLAIVSPSSLSGTAGVPVTFKVVATGVPVPTLSILNLNLHGLNFTDNGNGTGTISGVVDTPMASACIAPCGIQATNSQGKVVQPFSLDFRNPAPYATLIPPAAANFYTGTPNVQLLASAGAITPVSWQLFPGGNNIPPPPSWVTLDDNGNGTAFLNGTPPVGTTGAITFDVETKAAGAFGYLNEFTINVIDKPVFLSPNTTAFTVGTSDSFRISASQGTVTLVGGLPNGLTLSSGNPAAIGGIPAAGTGGQYIVELVANAPGTEGSSTQALTLNVNEGPAIPSPPSALFFAGMPGTFPVTTTGFPFVSSQYLLPGQTPNPLHPPGMKFTVTGLPAGLHASNRNAADFTTGTLTIQGTPSDSNVGDYPVQITAQNGVGTPAQQTLALKIVKLTGPAPVSGNKCNGIYNGTFRGNVVVSAGQNCTFAAGGRITGNVNVHGGNLTLTNSSLSGNLAILGSSAFSIDGATIDGNLLITCRRRNVQPDCGATVSGNADVTASATPVQVGSSDQSCPGNTFGKNVIVERNMGPSSFTTTQCKKTCHVRGTLRSQEVEIRPGRNSASAPRSNRIARTTQESKKPAGRDAFAL